MRLEKISLQNFRRIQNLELAFDQDFIVLVGPNASGKTTVLEGIYYTSVLQAFPPGKAWELIRFGENFFRLAADATDQKLVFYYGRKDERRYERSQTVNGARRKAGQIIGTFPVATFLPQDLNLLQLSPSLRRDYLDEILLQTEPDYEVMASEYAKVLAQRNELLGRIHAGRAGTAELEFWDEKLSALGSRITVSRQILCNFLNDALRPTYFALVGENLDCRLNYAPAPGGAEADGMLKLLIDARAGDVAAGRTSAGPHRDDWKILDHDQRDLSRFLSRGEQRSLIAALKVLETEYLRRALNTQPVILLDELLAELDDDRRHSIMEHLPEGSQKFLTTTDLEEVPQSILARAQVLELSR